MAAQSSKKVVIAAFAGNGLIAVTKIIAATFTGSAAMFSEAVHSAVDTGNQALLLYGMKRAARPADARHPFGYGREVYFWAFVVAIMIFATGAGVSIYEGIAKLKNPEPVTDAYINYIALGCKAAVLGVPVALAAGGEIGDSQVLRFAPDHGEEERARAIANILKASCGEASMMARCTGKTNLHNLEPEDMRALTLASAEAMDIPLVGRN